MFYFGVDYYPEHLPEECWQEDARLMQEAGFNIVRLAEFAWSMLEPQAGVFEFVWLDRVIEILSARGMNIVLGTPTAAMPPWMFTPEMALVDVGGVHRILGSRREYCPTNPDYQHYSVRITQKMAEHYRDNPHIIGWQIDNEFGDRCYCENCQRAFQTWLHHKHSTLENLNEHWGTVFWSHVYTDWSQVPVPSARIHALHNPGLQLDYYRFMSDAYVSYQQQQIDVLRQVCPHHFITHNFMGFGYDKINYFDLARQLDVVSWDNYPRGFWNPNLETPAAPIALSHATMRSLKNQNFWVMEQQSGPAAWDTFPPSPRPGELRLWAYQAIAHGADGILFFRWRTAHFGAEQYWHGIIDHDGIPRRRYTEIKQMGNEISRIGTAIGGAMVRPEVAIMVSYDTRFAFQIQAHNPQFSYSEHVHHYFAAFHDLNVPVAIVPPDADLTPFRLVIAPALHILNAATVETLHSFVVEGGTLIVTPRSGVKDIHNSVVNLPLPGLLADLCGIGVEEYDSLPAGQTRKVEFPLTEGNSGSAAIWCDILKAKGAEVLAIYAEDYYAGQPAITANSIGKGHALYVGSIGNPDLVKTVVEYVINLAQLEALLKTPTGVEATTRWQGNHQLLFLLNHTWETQTVRLDKDYCDLITGQAIANEILLKAKDVMILEPS